MVSAQNSGVDRLELGLLGAENAGFGVGGEPPRLHHLIAECDVVRELFEVVLRVEHHALGAGLGFPEVQQQGESRLAAA